jgi:hypothetical protein
MNTISDLTGYFPDPRTRIFLSQVNSEAKYLKHFNSLYFLHRYLPSIFRARSILVSYSSELFRYVFYLLWELAQGGIPQYDSVDRKHTNTHAPCGIRTPVAVSTRPPTVMLFGLLQLYKI